MTDAIEKPETNTNAKAELLLKVLGVCVVLGGFALFLLNQAQAQQVPLEKRIAIVEQNQSQQRTEIAEVQTDIRALYKAVMTGKPQDRLERPAPGPDGGP